MRFVITLTITILTAFGWSESAWALQSHGAPEGIYVHQMAHVLFMASLGYLYWHTRRTQEAGNRGWKYLQLFCVLLFCWNILAFTGHEIFERLDPQDFIDKNSWSARLAFPLNLKKFLYYVTKMDHFLVVPAFMALVVSLRTFYKQAKEEAGK